MSTKTVTPSRPDEEIWECTIPGRVSMDVSNDRGGTKHISVVGNGKRLRITTIDRERAEEVIREGQNNPFRNGMLVRIDANKGEHVPSTDELSDDDLKVMFDLDNETFEAMVPELSEVNVRRLKALAKAVDARQAQVEFLTTYLEENYAIGGTVPSWEEMQVRR